MRSEESCATIRGLLDSFVSAAVGLTLEVCIIDAGDLPDAHRGCLTSTVNNPRVWAAWYTNIGPVSACACYDYGQSLRVGAHVLCIEWWLAAGERYEGWWHCYPKRPREWIKGAGARIESSYW